MAHQEASAASTPVGFDPFEVSRLREEVKLLRFLETIRAHLQNARDAESALRFIVRAVKEHFDATAVCLAVTQAPSQPPHILFAIPQEQVWPRPMFEALLRGEKTTAPQGSLIFARIRRRDRLWGVLALRRAIGEFDKPQRQALVRVGAAISGVLQEIDTQRIREVRDRIDRKIMSEVKPIDLSYQILDALRSLTGYDHSSAVLMNDGSGSALQIVAEQIAWRKAKSNCIGATLPISPKVQKLLDDGNAYGFTRSEGRWVEWGGGHADELAKLLDYNIDDHPESQILCAPIVGRDGVIGVIKVSAVHPDTLGAFEAQLLSAFLPQVSIALQNAQRAESLESKMIAAERKHAMADLARGVAHDLNNALGSVLPLIEQMRQEAENRSLDPTTSIEDLRQIETSLQTCRRIFNGMLTFARRAGGGVGQGQVRYAIECAMAILEDNLRRRSIHVQTELAELLPAISGGQSALEQLVLNLLTNARDAMPDGGEIRICADCDEQNHLRLTVADTGCGIAPEHLPLVLEPFFTTKSTGSGLGLSICRSIVWDMGGKILFESTVGKGTRVTLLLPTTEELSA